MSHHHSICSVALRAFVGTKSAASCGQGVVSD